MIIHNEQEITAAVLSELQRADDPRFREIIGAAVRHLHDFVREVEPSQQEWAEAIDFLLKQMSRSKNNKEFFVQMREG